MSQAAITQASKLSKLVIGATLLGCSLYFIASNAHLLALRRDELGKYFDVRALLFLHITGGAVALMIGPFQFWDGLRTKQRALHRRMGMAYVVAIAVSAPCASYLSLTTAYAVGRPYALSLQVWVTVWMTSTWLAYRYARTRQFDLHQAWMTRSYLVTFAFVLSALLMKLPAIARQGSFAEVSPGLFWAGWSVPLFLFDVVRDARAPRARR